MNVSVRKWCSSVGYWVVKREVWNQSVTNELLVSPPNSGGLDIPTPYSIYHR